MRVGRLARVEFQEGMEFLVGLGLLDLREFLVGLEFLEFLEFPEFPEFQEERE